MSFGRHEVNVSLLHLRKLRLLFRGEDWTIDGKGMASWVKYTVKSQDVRVLCGVSWLDPGLLLWIVSMAEDGLPKIRQSGKACLVPGWLYGLCLLLLAEAHESGLQTRLGPPGISQCCSASARGLRRGVRVRLDAQEGLPGRLDWARLPSARGELRLLLRRLCLAARPKARVSWI